MHPVQIRSLAVAGSTALLLVAGRAWAAGFSIGAPAPDFDLPGTDGKQHSLAEISAAHGDHPAPRATVVVFSCNHCPYAKAYEPVLIDMAQHYAAQGVAFVLVNPNDPKIVPEDSFEKMQERAKEKAYPFPYLFDATQQTARAYGATVTPHVFLLDGKRVLRYRGRVSDSHDPARVKSNDLRNAIDAVLAGRAVETATTKAFGCSIKWKKES